MITLKKVKVPKIEEGVKPVPLTDETMEKRYQKVIDKMKKHNLETIVIYADLEHSGNFEYLSGFVPRFEEALLVIHSDKQAYMVLGNENLNKASKSRIKVNPVHMPHFSLPNQPMEVKKSVTDILSECEFADKKRIGLVGWKNFTSQFDPNETLFDIPHFVVAALKDVCKGAIFTNVTHLFIGENGVRTTNNANEFAHYEFGATLGGNCIIHAMNTLEPGKTEMEIADALASGGQYHSVVTIMASGERFVKANLYPTDKSIEIGERISLTTGFKGGLQSRSGYAVKETEELPVDQQDYLDKVAIPYFNAVKTWLETIRVGIKGQKLYDTIQNVLPKEIYGWALNPGHLCADEEWLSSPIYKGSQETIQSGMLFQIDFIPAINGYGGASCESGVFLADKALREDIKKLYPELWHHIELRRKYMDEELGIKLSEEVLPTSIATAYYRPYLLNKEKALTAK